MSFARDYTLKPKGGGGVSSSPATGGAQHFIIGQGLVKQSLPEPAWPEAEAEAAVAGPHYPDTTQQRLSAEEIKFLGIASKMAFDKCLPVPGAVPPARTKKERMDNWRHEQVAIATEGRATGLTKAARADFRNIFGRFLHLAGITEAAFRVLMRTGKTRGGAAVETTEQINHWIFGLLARVKRHFATQGPKAEERVQAWLKTIVAGKEAKYNKPWHEWEPKPRTDLYFTLKNRFAAMTGAGETRNRNKKQRRQPANPF